METDTVKLALRAQKSRNLSAGSAGADPSIGLKDIIPISDIVKVSDVLLKGDRPDWTEAFFNFNWGWNQGLRGASSRKLELKDLNWSDGFGPGAVGIEPFQD